MAPKLVLTPEEIEEMGKKVIGRGYVVHIQFNKKRGFKVEYTKKRMTNKRSDIKKEIKKLLDEIDILQRKLKKK